ncbi:MAG: hypothetical protein EBS01_15210 [Verrucomicrobia bacterium]|nr:hypothetical protein [Verrucomicrobiota bacterium]
MLGAPPVLDSCRSRLHGVRLRPHKVHREASHATPFCRARTPASCGKRALANCPRHSRRTGASLAAIALISTRAQQNIAANSEVAGSLHEISKRAKQTARQLAEIVWAVNPARDSVENLVDFVCQFAQEHLELANIRFRTEIPGELPELALSSSARHEAFLAAKELVHNAVRHGKPTQVVLKIECSPRWLCVVIEDNGCGFVPPRGHTHGGLANVAERMKKVGGEFEAHSVPSQGSRMQLRIPLSTTHG